MAMSDNIGTSATSEMQERIKTLDNQAVRLRDRAAENDSEAQACRANAQAIEQLASQYRSALETLNMADAD